MQVCTNYIRSHSQRGETLLTLFPHPPSILMYHNYDLVAIAKLTLSSNQFLSFAEKVDSCQRQWFAIRAFGFWRRSLAPSEVTRDEVEDDHLENDRPGDV